jgi:hypothetical protein
MMIQTAGGHAWTAQMDVKATAGIGESRRVWRVLPRPGLHDRLG